MPVEAGALAGVDDVSTNQGISEMRKGTVLRSTFVLAIALALGGCGGGSSTVQATTTTMGQELMDLDASYKKGLLSEDEYKDARKKIMERYE